MVSFFVFGMVCSCTKTLCEPVVFDKMKNNPLIISKIYSTEPFVIDSATLRIQRSAFEHFPENFTTLNETLDAFKEQKIGVKLLSFNKEDYFDFSK